MDAGNTRRRLGPWLRGRSLRGRGRDLVSMSAIVCGVRDSIWGFRECRVRRDTVLRLGAGHTSIYVSRNPKAKIVGGYDRAS